MTLLIALGKVKSLIPPKMRLIARKKTLLIALGKVESLTPPKMRLIAMKEEEKALKMPHKMKRMKKRDLAMTILKIRRMDSQMKTKTHQISRKKTMRTMKREIHKRNHLLTVRRRKVTRAMKMKILLVTMTMNVRTMKPLDGERKIEAVHGLHLDPKRR